VFGLIESVMGFRPFLTRGLDHVQNERTLVALAWNFERMVASRLLYGKAGGNPGVSPQNSSFTQPAILRGFDTDTPRGKSDCLLDTWPPLV
jgi:hypothetical protein